MKRVLAATCIVALFSSLPLTVYADVSLSERFTRLEQEFGLPAGILGRVAKAETGNCSARATAGRLSSATGLFQWLSSSWSSVAPRVNARYGDLSLRFDPFVSAHVTAYALKNIQNANGPLIQQAGIDMTLGIYMGHFLGQGGSRTFLNAYIQNPNQNAAALFPVQARSNPGVFRHGTLRGILQYFTQKLSTSCTSATNYTSTLNDGPIGSTVADQAVAAAAPFTPGSALHRDPERDYVDTYPPPMRSQPQSMQQMPPQNQQYFPPTSQNPSQLSPQFTSQLPLIGSSSSTHPLLYSPSSYFEGEKSKEGEKRPITIDSGKKIEEFAGKEKTIATSSVIAVVQPIRELSHVTELRPAYVAQESPYRYEFVSAPNTFGGNLTDTVPLQISTIAIIEQLLLQFTEVLLRMRASLDGTL